MRKIHAPLKGSWKLSSQVFGILSSLGKLVRANSSLDGALDFKAPNKLVILLKDSLNKWSTNDQDELAMLEDS